MRKLARRAEREESFKKHASEDPKELFALRDQQTKSVRLQQEMAAAKQAEMQKLQVLVAETKARQAHAMAQDAHNRAQAEDNPFGRSSAEAGDSRLDQEMRRLAAQMGH